MPCQSTDLSECRAFVLQASFLVGHEDVEQLLLHAVPTLLEEEDGGVGGQGVGDGLRLPRRVQEQTEPGVTLHLVVRHLPPENNNNDDAWQDIWEEIESASPKGCVFVCVFVCVCVRECMHACGCVGVCGWV